MAIVVREPFKEMERDPARGRAPDRRIEELPASSVSPASEFLHRSVIDTSPDPIFVTDLAGRLLMANPAAARLLGFDSVETLLLAGADAVSVLAPVHREWAHRRLRELAQRPEADPVEYELVRRDGTLVPVELKAAPLRADDGKPCGGIFVTRDLTERRRADREWRQLQAQLERTQRLESLGVLAGGIAHDFNNLLVGIIGSASLLRREIPEGAKARTAVDRIEAAAERAAELTHQLLAYAGRGKITIGPVDLGAAVRQMDVLLRASIPERIVFRYHLGDGLAPVQGDAGQIHQVVMNLIINAAEAIGDHPGGIDVRTSMADLGAGTIDEGSAAPVRPGRYACLEVTDTGSGMNLETRRRIFEPFFSTKFTGRGLGLAAVAGIVRSHGGAILVQSQVGLGTTFQVFLPPAPAPSPSELEQAFSRPVAGGLCPGTRAGPRSK